MVGVEQTWRVLCITPAWSSVERSEYWGPNCTWSGRNDAILASEIENCIQLCWQTKRGNVSIMGRLCLHCVGNKLGPATAVASSLLNADLARELALGSGWRPLGPPWPERRPPTPPSPPPVGRETRAPSTQCRVRQSSGNNESEASAVSIESRVSRRPPWIWPSLWRCCCRWGPQRSRWRPKANIEPSAALVGPRRPSSALVECARASEAADCAGVAASGRLSALSGLGAGVAGQWTMCGPQRAGLSW